MAKLFKYTKQVYICIAVAYGTIASIFSLLLFCIFSFIIVLPNAINIMISFAAFVVSFSYTFVKSCKQYNKEVECNETYVNKLLLKDKSESYKGVCGSDFVFKE